jgi:arginyl-tRNA synthetase
VAALGFPADRLDVRIVQLVTLLRDGKPVVMSKREGEMVTLAEVMDDVGIDATRYFYLMRTMDSHLEFNLDLAKSKVRDNPVYYVQYAHARIASILGFARQQLPAGASERHAPMERLQEPEERLLTRHLILFPKVLDACARTLEPHGLTGYLQQLSELFHVFYGKHRVITDDIELSVARLALVRATKQVLANGLGLVGAGAPDQM